MTIEKDRQLHQKKQSTSLSRTDMPTLVKELKRLGFKFGKVDYQWSKPEDRNLI